MQMAVSPEEVGEIAVKKNIRKKTDYHPWNIGKNFSCDYPHSSQKMDDPYLWFE